MNLIKELNIDISQLDKKKQQTSYKIKYIKEYINGWIQVSANRPNIQYINFIDCMCNAGIYADGEFGTPIEVLKIFISIAKKYSSKEYHIYLNDYNQKRIDVIKSISRYFLSDKDINNIYVHFECKDANKYIQNFSTFDRTLLNNASTILFVDPYNFQSIELLPMKEFTKHYYCELYYNLFTSDYIRNKNNSDIFSRILSTNTKFDTREDLVKYVRNFFRTDKMQYSFSYGFRNEKNAEIYQILFVTPNIKGLEKLKEALVRVFKGLDYYRNKAKQEQQQGSLFGDDEEKFFEKNIFTYFGKEVQVLLCKELKRGTYSYSEIEKIILEQSPLSNNNIIEYVLKPLIKNGKIIKNNKRENKKNFKDDTYTFLDSVLCRQ